MSYSSARRISNVQLIIICFESSLLNRVFIQKWMYLYIQIYIYTNIYVCAKKIAVAVNIGNVIPVILSGKLLYDANQFYLKRQRCFNITINAQLICFNI